VIDPVPGAAAERLRRLDDALGRTYISDALILAGTPSEVADHLESWAGTGLTGFRLRPAALPDDLDGIVDGLVPELQRRGRHRTAYGGQSLRARLGLPRPANRYASAR
jgi:alkanesulfonate monooxygenase SsuD/methylene tetrahydromethanopterin reductase-like flavin-dependent oxidoreductase (luciferase family)